jgi:hypothetical protein
MSPQHWSPAHLPAYPQSHTRPLPPAAPGAASSSAAAHDPWRWLVAPALHATAVVVAGVVLAVWATAADGDAGLGVSLLQSVLGVLGAPFSLSALALADTAPPAATAAVLLVTALLWVVPHAGVSYWRSTRR